jgi:hypothetical protein
MAISVSMLGADYQSGHVLEVIVPALDVLLVLSQFRNAFRI